MTTSEKQKFIDILAAFTGYSSKHLPDDVVERLTLMREKEDSPMAKLFYDAMFSDLEKASELDRPCCQDTGVLQYFVQVGSGFPLIDEIEDSLREAVKKATIEAPLRHNVVEIFDEYNTGDNTGTRIPWIDWEVLPHCDSVTIYMYMAGGGCSLPGTAKVLMPLEGYEGAMKYILDQVTSYGVNACPPLLLGIGIGGSVEVAAKLSKKALLRRIGTRNKNQKAAELELKMEEAINRIKIGPGGVSGNASVMAVHIEQAGRHPSTLAVGMSTGCWAHRRACIRINHDLSYELLTHKGVTL